jgi:PAS domain-containing protein
MSNQHIELILSRQLADSLSIAAFLVDTKGNLLFFNEPAENLLGMRFEETGVMPAEEWSSIFVPQKEDGTLLPMDSLPLVKTLQDQAPNHGVFWIIGLDGKQHQISVTSFPIVGRMDSFVGAIALFWKTREG